MIINEYILNIRGDYKFIYKSNGIYRFLKQYLYKESYYFYSIKFKIYKRRGLKFIKNIFF